MVDGETRRWTTTHIENELLANDDDEKSRFWSEIHNVDYIGNEMSDLVLSYLVLLSRLLFDRN